MVRSAWSLPACALLLMVAGCQDRSVDSPASTPPTVPDPATATPAVAPAAPATTAPAAATPDAVAAGPVVSSPDAWLGKWTGPEGTFLLLEKHEGGGYVVTIQSLDGRESYDGDGTGSGIVFERNGKTETLRAGSGKLTGMKWLADKSDCLLIQAGEGFCRD